MIETCEQLTHHVRRNLGSSNALTNLKAHETHGFVSFRWYERDFVIKRSLEVFEVKGQNLFATGASMLMHTVLKRAETDRFSAEGIVNSIRTAEDLLADEKQRDAGFKLLSNIKAALKKLAHSKEEVPQFSVANARGALAKEIAPDSADHIEPAAVH
ncbi:MAG: hypothetical protein HYY23_03100 [Verrucomicrobia bacterium]|nr:hypothetical protein [Verrucomicrobiota bacterium]